MQVSRKLIENVGELKKALNEISVYDLDVYTSMELYYKIANKLNEVIKELMRFEGLVSDEVIKQNEKLVYLLGEGLNSEVVKKINQMIADGTMDTIINHNVFNSLNNKVENYKKELSSQIKEKASKQELETERERINTFVSLAEGSTTGDAELIDGRIGADGKAYTNIGESIRNQIKNVSEDMYNFAIKQDLEITPSLTNGYIDFTNGNLGNWDNNLYQRTNYIRIPYGTERIIINSKYNTEGNGGYAIYDANKNYIEGGKNKEISSRDNYKYIATTVYNSEFNEQVTIKFIPIKRESVFENDDKLQKIDISKVMENGYINSTNGSYDNFPNDSYYATKSFVKIPYGTKYIINNFRYNTEGNAGYAIYNEDKIYIEGGKDNIIDVSAYCNSQIYIRITDFDTINKNHNYRYMYFVLPYDYKIINQLKPFHEKTIGFVGDSITFGFDDDNNGEQLDKPWVDQVGELLDCAVINYGVSSASLMNNDKFTEEKQLLKVCDSFDDKIDYLVTMIGINDFYRGYNLGSFEDRTEESFYGCLHIYYKKMLEKYPAENNHKLIVMIYPHYDIKPNFDKWQKAMREVAQYYSLPIIDLSQIMGISPYMDTNFKYWRSSEGGHSAHLTQLGANIVAKCIANYIFRMFKI